jgi:hypothetical protein
MGSPSWPQYWQRALWYPGGPRGGQGAVRRRLAQRRCHELAGRAKRLAAQVSPPRSTREQRREVVDAPAALAAEAPPALLGLRVELQEAWGSWWSRGRQLTLSPASGVPTCRHL